MTDYVSLEFVKLFTPKVRNPSGEYFHHDKFYSQLICNGPPQSQNESPMFNLMSANMGR